MSEGRPLHRDECRPWAGAKKPAHIAHACYISRWLINSPTRVSKVSIRHSLR
jgi:hypothetical protein